MTRIQNEDAPHYVYSFLDATGAPIYIGVTGLLGCRLDGHRPKPYWPEVVRVEIDVFPTRTEAYAAERERIQAADPKYNVTHTTRDPRPKRAA